MPELTLQVDLLYKVPATCLLKESLLFVLAMLLQDTAVARMPDL
jgi:hypothetical protein